MGLDPKHLAATADSVNNAKEQERLQLKESLSSEAQEAMPQLLPLLDKFLLSRARGGYRSATVLKWGYHSTKDRNRVYFPDQPFHIRETREDEDESVDEALHRFFERYGYIMKAKELAEYLATYFRDAGFQVDNRAQKWNEVVQGGSVIVSW